MVHLSIKCTVCGEMFAWHRARKYCTNKCRDRAAYLRSLERAPRCPRCNGPWQKVTGKKLYCHKCYTDPTEDRTRPVAFRACKDCGEDTGATRRNRCNPCRHIYAKQKAEAEGKVCGCGKPVISSGKCSACYSREYRAKNPGKRVRKDPTYAKTCEFCDHDFTTTDNRAKFCSRECVARDKAGYSRSKEIALIRSDARASRIWVGHTIPARAGVALVNGQCIRCGEQFTSQYAGMYCSDRCSNNASWARRYKRRGEFNISPRIRREIYERDNWTCQLCGNPVPQGEPGDVRFRATLDHIIPQSLQLVPDHSASNLRLAHMLCNSKRGNRMEAVELAA